MKGYGFQWRMARRRLAAGLLVLLFTAVVTIFMLIYPRLIESTEARLEEAYETIEVSGWMINTKDYTDPAILGMDWRKMVNAGYFRTHHDYSSTSYGVMEAGILDMLIETELQKDISPETRLEMIDKLKRDEERQNMIDRTDTRAFNCPDASPELLRMLENETITWAEGYFEDCINGDDMVCILPAELGYQPGDLIPLVIEAEGKNPWGPTLQITVAGVYQGQNSEYEIIMPLLTHERICEENGRLFMINSMIFDIEDNHRLDEFKTLLVDMGYDGAGELAIRAAIDDRILQGTVAPIESNLAMLEGLFAFFFAVIAVIGFFLCFLLARNRKPEYAIMRMLGESVAQITVKALSEQSALCLLGTILGAVIVTVTALGRAEPLICGGILLCYTIGAAVAVLMTVRVNVMEILRDKE